MKKIWFLVSALFLLGSLSTCAHAETVILQTGWEDGEWHGWENRLQYPAYNCAGYFNSYNPPPECGRRYIERVRSGEYSLLIAGYSQARYSYCYYRLIELNRLVQPGMKIGYWIYHVQGEGKIAVDGHFTDGTTIRDLGNQAIRDQYGIPIHPALRRDPMNQWHYVEVDLTPAVGKTIDFLMFAFDNGNQGYIGPYRAYVDDLKIFIVDSPQGTSSFQTGWEDGEDPGLVNRVEYRRAVPRPEAYRVVGFARGGRFSYLVAGESQDHYSYCYYRVFDVNIPVVEGMKMSYWIYHSQGTPQVAVDGHFADGSTIRDFGERILRDQHGIQIHPALRQDPMTQWHYVEVDLSPAKNKILKTILFAFDNGGNNFLGRFEAYIDDLRIFVAPSQQPNCPQENVSPHRWRGEYFNNMGMSGPAVMVRDDGEGFLNFQWELGSPHPCIPSDEFSVRWTRTVQFSGGRYVFTATVDDGFRLYIDGQLVKEVWFDQARASYSATVDLTPGPHTIVMEYYENGGYAIAQLNWSEVSGPAFRPFFYTDPLNIPTTPGDDGWYESENKSAEQNRNEIALAVDPTNGTKAQAVREHLARGGRVVLLVCGLGNWGTGPSGWERPIATYANDYLDAVVLRVNYGLGSVGFIYQLSFSKGVDRVTQMVLKARKAGSNRIRLYGHSEGSDVSAKVVAIMASPTNRWVYPKGLFGSWYGQGNPDWFEGGFGFGNPADVGICVPNISPLPPTCIGLTSAAAPPPDPVKLRGGFFRYVGEYNGNYYGNKYVLFNRKWDPANTGHGFTFFVIAGMVGTSGHDYRGVFSFPEFMAEYEAVLNPTLRPANTSGFLWGDGAYVDRDAGERFDIGNIHWIPYIPGSDEASQSALTIVNNPPNGLPSTVELSLGRLNLYDAAGNAVDERTLVLNEYASQEVTHPMGARGAGSAVFFTNEQVGMITRYQVERGDRYFGAAYPSESYPSRTLYVPFLAKGWNYGRNDWRQSTELILFNPNPWEAQVTIVYFNGTPGTSGAEHHLSRSISPKAMLRLDSADLPSQWSGNAGILASARVHADVPLVGMVRNRIGQVGSSTGTVYTQYGESNYRVFTTRGSKKIFAPFLKVSSQGDDSFLYVQNTGDREVTFSIRLYGSGGGRWDTIPSQSLPPNSMREISLRPYVPSPFVGSAVLEVIHPSSGTLALAVQVISNHGVEAHEGIPDGTYTYQKRNDMVQIPFILDQRNQSDAQWDSEINVINMGSASENLTVQYRRMDGGEVKTLSRTVDSERVVNLSLPGDLPDFVPPNLFQGSVVVEGKRDQKRLGAAVEIRRLEKQYGAGGHDITMGYSAWW